MPLKRRVRRWTLAGIVLVLVIGMASALNRASLAGSPMAVAEEIRDDLRVLRAELEACLRVQGQLERRFEALTRRTDELRERLDSLESLDVRGVPGELYTEYLSLVDAYNESIPEWEEQGEALRRRAARCRALIEIHNDHADSLQRFLVDEGIWEEEWIQPRASEVDPAPAPDSAPPEPDPREPDDTGR